jgi:hypothetical protein
MRIQTLLAASVLALPLTTLAEGTSPWLPIPGDRLIGLNHTEQSADSAYIGGSLTPVIGITGGGASKFKRSTTTVRFGWGISDTLALDASIGSGRVKVGKADNDNGVTDALVGLSWRVVDEFLQPGLPTVTVRGGAILNGNYDGARLAALGNDASGIDLSVLIGKEISSAFALSAELGVQNRSASVPNATYFELTGRVRLAPGLSANLGYSSKKYSGNLDIGGAGFSPARFQQVRAERGVVKLGLGYAFAANQGVALNFAKVTSGRNTVKDDSVVGLSYTFGF